MQLQLGTRSARPVLLLHGFASSPAVMRPLEHSLRKALGREVIRLAISPGRDDLRDSARQVDRQLDELARRGRFEYADVVAHSMGGLVATELLKRIDRGRRVRRVVTLGTPHRGTPLALLGVVLLGRLSRAVWQMVPGSKLLRDLARTPVPEGCELVSIAGSGDHVVPSSFAELSTAPGHRNLRLEGASHMQLVFSRQAHALVGNALAAEPIAPASGAPIRIAA
jgi:pimeloyl-ACP methyl ester carboxylesterase